MCANPGKGFIYLGTYSGSQCNILYIVVFLIFRLIVFTIVLYEFKGGGGLEMWQLEQGRVGFPEKGGIFISQSAVPGQLKFSGWQFRRLAIQKVLAIVQASHSAPLIHRR